MNFLPFLSTSQPCAEAYQWAIEQLGKSGLRTVRTFDLLAARAGLHDGSCPNHGTSDCDCQMVVLLVYGKAEEPATLILHGNDGHTWFSIADNPQQGSNTLLSDDIQQILKKEPAFPSKARSSSTSRLIIE